MILFVEPISRNIDMYVPAFPLSVLEIASFVKSRLPDADLEVVSLPVDYGLPLCQEGKEKIYSAFLKDLEFIKPRGIGISCTAIAQAEGVMELCERIKAYNPDIFIFLGGYFPTVYYDEILARTTAVDLIVLGEGEEPSLKIAASLGRGQTPVKQDIPSVVWKEGGEILFSERGARFDLRKKAHLNLGLLKYPRAYDILPYSFSRGCPYDCSFCMEEFIRPQRRIVPDETVYSDLNELVSQTQSRTLLVCDALFKSFEIFPFLRSLNVQVNFETRCDVLEPSLISEIGDVCGTIALGFESASYGTLKRMNKVRDRAHYDRYISNTMHIFQEAVKNEIPVMVFMIAGFPGDTREDLEESLRFAEALSKNRGPGGHIFKIGECRVYPKTRIYELARSQPDVLFDDKGVFGENVVKQPSRNLDFETVLEYMEKIFHLSQPTPKFENNMLRMMPFFRIPPHALQDEMIPETCFMDSNRTVFNAKKENLSTIRELIPDLKERYKDWMSKERSARSLRL